MSRHLATLFAVALLSQGAPADVVEQPPDRADTLWDRTVEYAGATLDSARRFWREEHPADARLWDDLIPRLDEVIALDERQDQLPTSAWFGDDQVSNAAAIDALLDEVATLLVSSPPSRTGAG